MLINEIQKNIERNYIMKVIISESLRNRWGRLEGQRGFWRFLNCGELEES